MAPVKFSLIVPTYNEAANIAELCRQLIAVLKDVPFEFEIIIVDDDSPDGTSGIVQGLAKEDRRIKLLSRINKKGLATAVIYGWEYAQGEILGVIDADLQHPAQVLKTMLKLMLEDEIVDIVVASRFIKGGAILGRRILRRFISRVAILIGNIFIPKAVKIIKDPMSGYFILRRRVVRGKTFSPIGYKILLEVLVKGDYKKVIEVPYIFEERPKGGSKAGIKQYFISLVHFIRLNRFSISGDKMI